MMEDEECATLVDLLIRRSDVVAHLADTPAAATDLTEATGIPRSTIDRSLTELRAAGIVTATDSRYHLTLMGRLAVGQYRELATTYGTLASLATKLATLPAETDLPSAVIRDGTVADEPAVRRRQLLEGAERIDVLLSPTPPGLSAYLDGVGSPAVRALLPAPATRRLATAGSASHIRSSAIEIRETDDPLPFSLVRIDDGTTETLALCGHASGAIDWLLSVSAPDAISWADDVIARRWGAGTTIPRPG